METGSRALPSSPSWDPEKKETALFLRFWVPLAGEPVAEQNKKREQNILHPALLRGKEWCGHHLLKSRIQRLRVARLRNAACPGASRAWQGQRRAAPLSCGQLHAVAVVKAAAEAELERRWRPQEGALGNEQTEGLQPAVGWRQQRTAGAGYVETPPSAAVRRRTVGQSPPPLRRIGRPRRSGCLRNDVCQIPSYPPRSAIGGAPGPPTWTSSDPGPAP